MSRQQVYQDMKNTIGLVPTFIKTIPDESLQLEWELFKQAQLAEGAVPNKYRELIGLGIAAVIKCKYCIFFHTEVAKLNGATPEEIEDALHFAKSTAGWSTYISGFQTDFDKFQKEVLSVCDHVRAQAAGAARS